MPDVTILGAGIAGLSAGWLLKNLGIDFTILEKNAYPGGLARSFTWHGFSCDFAAHRLFTQDENVLQQLLKLVQMGRHIRRSRIYLNGHWMRDPLDIMELAQNLSPRQNLSILFSYLLRPKNLPDANFENYVLRRYGQQLYHLFFQPYTEKLFGIPGKEISVLWAQQKVRLANPLDNLRENTKTKFQYFYYPIRGGYGAIANTLYEEVKDQVIFNAKITGFEKADRQLRKVIFDSNGQSHTIHTDMVISTLPLPLTTSLLGHPIRLQFQKVDAVYLWIDRPLVSDYHWIYFMDKDISINRLVEFKNMSSIDTPADSTVICAEVTQDHPDPERKVIHDLAKIGFIQEDEIKDSMVVRENFAYPVYNDQYDSMLEQAREIIDGYENIYTLGRGAEFRHREVDDVFSTANEVVRQISKRLHIQELITVEKEPILDSETKRITAVILTYNHFEDTQECLQSLMDADHPALDILVVDNGSTDDTPRKIREGFPHVQVIENGQNLGVPAGYNVGFRYALQHGASYILMLNNDTLLSRDMIEKLFTQAEGDPLTGMVMPKVLYHGSNTEVWSSGGRYRKFPPAILMTDKRKEVQNQAVRLIEYAPSCGLLISRQAFERVGLFDPGYFFYFDDWDFSERVRAHGLHIWYVDDAILWHKVSRTTRGPQDPLFWYTMGGSMARFYRRHGRPVWISLAIHLGYYALREFGIKQNWKFWGVYWKGVMEGLQKPLGSYPEITI